MTRSEIWALFVIFAISAGYTWSWYFDLRRRFRVFHYDAFRAPFRGELAAAICFTLLTIGCGVYLLL